MELDRQLERQLRSIDWDFDSNVTGAARPTHWYPGSFHSQVPATLVEALSKPSDVIFDPYVGVGTLSFEALRQGRKVWATDLNVVAIISAYTQSSLICASRYDRPSVDAYLSLFLKLLERRWKGTLQNTLREFYLVEKSLAKLLEVLAAPSPDLFAKRYLDFAPPNLKALERWIHSQTLAEIQALYEKLNESISTSFSRIFLFQLISSNLWALSSQNQSWGHISDNVLPKTLTFKNVATQLQKSLATQRNSLSRTEIVQIPCDARSRQFWIAQHDWSSLRTPDCRPRSPLHLMITSPPYGNAIDYIYGQRLSFYFLGLSDEQIRSLHSKEIGARRKRTRNTSLRDWAEELQVAVERQVAFIDGGYLAIVLPHNNHGRQIGVISLLDCLVKNGWELFLDVDRSINQKRARQSWTSIKKETIYFFSKRICP